MSVIKNKFFIRMFCCLIAVVFVFSFVLVCVKIDALRKQNDATVKNMNIEFVNEAKGMGQMLYQLRAALHEVSVGISSDARFADNTYIEKNDIRNNMRAILVDRHQNEFSGFLSAVFVVDKRNPGVIYEYAATYKEEEFFFRFSGTEYTDGFWFEKINGDSVFEILKASEFSVVEDSMQRVVRNLLPIIYKPRSDSNYAIITLLDADKLTERFDISGIYSERGEPLHIRNGTKVNVLSEAAGPDDRTVIATDDGYLFKEIDSKNENINIVKFVSDREIKAAGKISLLRELIFPLSLTLVMIGVAAWIAYIYAKKMKGVSELVFESIGQPENGVTIPGTIDELAGAVKLMASHSVAQINTTTSKDSVLDSMYLQSKMRDVYVGVEDIEKSVDVSGSFFMVYCRVNYKEEFANYIGSDSGKATFLLKQLIEMYLETLGVRATTFQIEKNGIVSVFDMWEGFADEKEIVDDMRRRLENESEYAFFTIAVSNVYDGMENVKGVYDALIDLSKYSKPIEETQILYEGNAQLGTSRFYFSVEEMGKLSAILQNGNEEDVIRKIDEILEYNIKKDINCFELYLLSTEIINCAVKVINRTLHTIPQNIKLSAVYKELEAAYTPGEYREICTDFLGKVMLALRSNKREDDYIISYILEYIDNHYAEDIYLNLFAEKLKLTGAYISSYFKEKMNVNLSDYLNNYRIKKAVELSENPQNKNKDIAVMVGLPNINTFIRLFKKYTGHTPGEYRKKHYGDDYKK